MFERFTEVAIKVIMISQEETRRLGHGYVGTEQFLIGLVGQRSVLVRAIFVAISIIIKL
jgi:ATP-dependent Clp protease ATP-binding subunit ClpC